MTTKRSKCSAVSLVFAFSLLLGCSGSGSRPPLTQISNEAVKMPVTTASVIAHDEQFASYSQHTGFVRMMELGSFASTWYRQVGKDYYGFHALPGVDAVMLYSTEKVSLVAREGVRDFPLSGEGYGPWVKAKHVNTFVNLHPEQGRLHVFEQTPAAIWELKSELFSPAQGTSAFVSDNGETIIAVNGTGLAYDVLQREGQGHTLARQCPSLAHPASWVAADYDSATGRLVLADSQKGLYSLTISVSDCGSLQPITAALEDAVSGISVLGEGRMAIETQEGAVHIFAFNVDESSYLQEASYHFDCAFPADYLELSDSLHAVICLNQATMPTLNAYTYASMQIVSATKSGQQALALPIIPSDYAGVLLDDKKFTLYLLGKGAFGQVVSHNLESGASEDRGLVNLEKILD